MDMTLDMEVGEDVITGGSEDYLEDVCINQVIFPQQHGFIYYKCLTKNKVCLKKSFDMICYHASIFH